MRLISAVSGVQFPAPPFIRVFDHTAQFSTLSQPQGELREKRSKIQIQTKIKDYRMEDQGIQAGYKSGRGKETGFGRNRRAALFPLLVLFLSLALIFPESSVGAEKKVKKQPAQKEVVQKEAVMTDANVQTSFKRAEEGLKRGDVDGSQKIFVKVYDYTKEALTTMTFIQGQYDKIVSDPLTNQSEREDIFIKLQRVKQVTAKYSGIKSASAYNLGYIFTKKGDPEKARKFLGEVVETTPFSTKKGSTWMKAKTLLLELYGLEGEF
jgi:hypothetical protein